MIVDDYCAKDAARDLRALVALLDDECAKAIFEQLCARMTDRDVDRLSMVLDGTAFEILARGYERLADEEQSRCTLHAPKAAP